MNDIHDILIVAVVAVVTIALRFLPFFILGEKRKTPEIILYLGKVLPYAIMGMLVVYCLRETVSSGAEERMAQFIACGMVVFLHLWKRNTLISIIGGTIMYMCL